jgi:hypothetical protein
VTVRLNVLEAFVKDAHAAASSVRVADAAARELEDVMRQGTVRAIGADLRLSNFRGGPVEFKPQRAPGRAALVLGGGTYALADAGRQQARRTIRSKRRGKVRGGRSPKRNHPATLLTPRGPRRSARGSRSAGLNITDTWSPKALEAAVKAAVLVVVDQFAKAA